MRRAATDVHPRCHEHAAIYFDLAIERCRQAGFRKIVLRGDTDFALTENFDRWDDDSIEFFFGIDAMPNLVKLAEELEESAWKPLKRRRSDLLQPSKPRRKRPNHKERIVVENEYQNKLLVGESIAEFEYRPGKCNRSYRVVVLRKQVSVTRGQQKLFDDTPYFFYISNANPRRKSSAAIVFGANQRCDQENNISQLKECALAAPLNDLVSNWAYMVIASLAWNLKVWSGLMIKPTGNAEQTKEQESIKRQIVRMDFKAFRDRLMMAPAQIIRRDGSLVYRLLSCRPSVDLLMLIDANVRRPLRT